MALLSGYKEPGLPTSCDNNFFWRIHGQHNEQDRFQQEAGGFFQPLDAISVYSTKFAHNSITTRFKKKFQAERAVAFRPPETVVGGGEFTGATTNRTDFNRKEVSEIPTWCHFPTKYCKSQQTSQPHMRLSHRPSQYFCMEHRYSKAPYKRREHYQPSKQHDKLDRCME